MRNPYVTGSWVRGQEHYGRDGSITHLLESPNNAFWIVGNRRMGKTSLLRQLEYLTRESSTYVPLYWDMQGSTNLDELGAELIFVIEDEETRFKKLVVDTGLLRNFDAIGIIRLLRRYVRAADKTLLLLIDEGEALLNITKDNPRDLARLRKVLQSGDGLRVVMASTKVLSRINEATEDTLTSPFLFGFSLLNLTGLDNDSTTGLIRQSQDPLPVAVGDEQIAAIKQATNNHPYLTQVLCSRLFDPIGRLNPLTPAALNLDTLLESYFDNDYRFLSPGERQTLLAVADGQSDSESIAREIDRPVSEVNGYIFSLQRLSQLRHSPQGLDIGNAFLRRWLDENREKLQDSAGAGEITDEATQVLIRKAQEQEIQYLLAQLQIQQANLGELEIQRAQYGIQAPLDLVNNINYVKLEIENLEQRLALLPPDMLNGYSL